MTANRVAFVVAVLALIAVLCVAAANLEAANQRDGLDGIGGP